MPTPEPDDGPIAPLPASYREPFDNATRSAEDDDRIRALWLGGSLGRGTADVGSDLDLIVTVDDDAFDGFCQDWRRWLDTVAPMLIARPVPRTEGIYYAVTETCERIDLVVEPAGGIVHTQYRHRVPVVDKDGLSARLPPPEDDTRGPHPHNFAALVEEFYRQQVIFPAAVVARADWLLGVVGVHNTQRLLYQLFCECNQPLPPMGVKQWSARLTEHQRDVLAALPNPAPNRADVIAAMLAVRDAVRTEGREAAQAAGMSWPWGVDDAVAAYWHREGLE